MAFLIKSPLLEEHNSSLLLAEDTRKEMVQMQREKQSESFTLHLC